MASSLFNSAVRHLFSGGINLLEEDLRAILIMEGSSVPRDLVDSDIDSIAKIRNLRESDDSGLPGRPYVRVAQFNTGSGVEVRVNAPIVFGAGELTYMCGNASADYIGILVYQYVDGTPGDDRPLAFLEFSDPVSSQATRVDVEFTDCVLMRFDSGNMTAPGVSGRPPGRPAYIPPAPSHGWFHELVTEQIQESTRAWENEHRRMLEEEQIRRREQLWRFHDEPLGVPHEPKKPEPPPNNSTVSQKRRNIMRD